MNPVGFESAQRFDHFLRFKTRLAHVMFEVCVHDGIADRRRVGRIRTLKLDPKELGVGNARDRQPLTDPSHGIQLRLKLWQLGNLWLAEALTEYDWTANCLDTASLKSVSTPLRWGTRHTDVGLQYGSRLLPRTSARTRTRRQRPRRQQGSVRPVAPGCTSGKHPQDEGRCNSAVGRRRHQAGRIHPHWDARQTGWHQLASITDWRRSRLLCHLRCPSSWSRGGYPALHFLSVSAFPGWSRVALAR